MYFFDSYAIVELLAGNPHYARFAKEPVTLSIFNLVEIYWSVLHTADKPTADKVYAQYAPAVVELPEDVVKAAVEFRKKHKRLDVSYADCIGYIYAQKHGLMFLTGDKAFKDVDGVEFVK